MRPLLNILFFLFLVVIQNSGSPLKGILGVVPNLVLVLMLLLIVFSDYRSLWWLVLVTALFLDLFSSLPFGLISSSFLATIYLTDWFNRKIFSTVKWWTALLWVVVGTLVYNLFLFLLGAVFQISSEFTGIYQLLEIGYHLLIGILFFKIVKWWADFVLSPQR